MLSKSKAILSSHRDAATRVSTYLDEAHGIKIKPIVALEILARALGAANWQVLSAMAEQGRAPRIGDTELASRIANDVLQSPLPSTPFDGTAFWGSAHHLPPIGPGSVLKDLLASDESTLAAGLTAVHRRPGKLLKGGRDLRIDHSEPESMRQPTIREEIWSALTSRSVARGRTMVGDVTKFVDHAQNAMGIVFSLGQRAAVRNALEGAICIVTGDRGTGKSVVTEGIVRAAVASGLANVFNTVRPATHKIGDVEFPRGMDGFPKLFNSITSPKQGAGPDAVILGDCDLLLIDERVLADKHLLRSVLAKSPAKCQIVVVLDSPALPEKTTEMGALVRELVFLGLARHIPLSAKMRRNATVEFRDRDPHEEVSAHGDFLRRKDTEPVSRFATLLAARPAEDASQASAKKPTTILMITDGEPPAQDEREPNDALGMPREAYSMSGFFDNGALPPTQSQHVPHYIYEAPAFQATDRTGKWCIFRDESTVDALWAKIRQAVVDKILPAAMVSSPKNARRHKGTYLICVFTHDWRNHAEAWRVRQILCAMGVDEELGYKRDLDTANEVYGTDKEWFYRA